MRENIETRCWDCPNRKGLSRLAGKAAIKFYETTSLGQRRINEQHGDCTGKEPVLAMSQGSGSAAVEGDTVTHTSVWHSVYLLACPQEDYPLPEVPSEVSDAMRVNGLRVFTHETIDIKTEPLADYEQRTADVRGRFQTLLAQRSVE